MAMSFNTNVTNVVTQYLQSLQVKITRTGIAGELQQNPFFPSLYSINNVLAKFNIPNEAFTLEAQHLDMLQPPFIAYYSNRATGKDFVLVTRISSTTVTYISDSKKEKTVSRKEFLENWEKIILVAEPTDKSGDSNYTNALKKERLAKRKKMWLLVGALMIAVAVITQFFFSNSNISPWAGAIVFTKLAGLSIALLLLAYEVDKTNSFIKNLCTGGKQTNCDAVLNSKAAGIAGIKWSEAGFFYFLSSSLFLFFPSVSFGDKIPWLALTATLVAPYIAFSVYYQYKVIKQWCPLCLATQAILLLELGWSIAIYWKHPVAPILNVPVGLILLSCILFPVIAWFMIKPLLQASKESAQYRDAYKRLLYNPDSFNQLLLQQEEAPEGWQQLGITIGNPYATTTILKVCNPYCGPCAKAHPELEEIIHHNNNINLKIIFTASSKEGDSGNRPVKHLLAIAEKNNPAIVQQALDDWYNADKKDYSRFAALYPMNGELKQQDEKVDAMYHWCNKAGIAATPTIFINGRPLPENYNINELKYIL